MTEMRLTEKASKEELSELLRSLKLYRNLRKKLGNRGSRLFEASRSGEKTLRVEYFPSFDRKDVEAALESAFGKDYAKGYRAEWKENPSLSGGIRAFFGDELVDLSFSRIERLLSRA